jgi:hypothetical protein
MNAYEYPHQRYMRVHKVRMNELPQDIKEMLVVWNDDHQRHSPKTKVNASLERASKGIEEEIDDYYDNLEIEDEPTPTPKAAKTPTYKGKDAILHALYTQGKTQVTEAELKEQGYKREMMLLPLTQAHYCLRAVKGAKNTYNIVKR